jgi:hypothetical protein
MLAWHGRLAGKKWANPGTPRPDSVLRGGRRRRGGSSSILAWDFLRLAQDTPR